MNNESDESVTQSKFHLGDKVQLVNTDRIGVITGGPRKISRDFYYKLFIDGVEKEYAEKSIELIAVIDNDVVKLLSDGNFSRLIDFRSYITFIKIERPLTNNLYSFLASRTQFEVHQFKPVLKFLQSPYQRLLIADEVGVGKTIEAAIIYIELLARRQLKNVLIICPAALCYKWQNEMRKRFNEDFPLIDSRHLGHFLYQYEAFPKNYSLKGIASLEMMRSDEFIERLDGLQVPFDLVIVDEAHHMRNQGTNSYRLGMVLSQISDSVVFLSATPLQIGNIDLFNLLHILLPDEFNEFEIFNELIQPNEIINETIHQLSQKKDPAILLASLCRVENTGQCERFLINPNYIACKDILSQCQNLTDSHRIMLNRMLNELNVLSHVYTRTKKKEIDVKSPIRKPRTVQVVFNDDEMHLYNVVSDLFIRIRPDVPEGFLLQMPQRQVASCIPAAIDYLEELARRGRIDLGEEDNVDETDGASRLYLNHGHIAEIQHIIDFGKSIKQPDSKTKAFINELKSILSNGEIKKVVVFSYFKRTLKYLERQIRNEGIKVTRIDGDIPNEQREVIRDQFADPAGFQVLLSSDVGREGIDMQFCNCMFNYDLPWNPMLIEQRIGRLDRYGQESPKIFIYNFSVEGTIETDIYLRLCERIGVFEQYVGELEPILGEVIRELNKNLCSIQLSSEEKEQKAQQAALVIEHKRQETEKFDQERTKLLGQDSYFDHEVNDILKRKRFITATEVTNLFFNFVRDFCPKTKIEEIKENDNTYNLVPDKVFTDIMEEGIESKKNIATNKDRLINLLSKSSFIITFDSSIANRNERIEFITIRHPIIEIIIECYKRKGFNKVTRIEWTDKEASADSTHLFFVYLLEVSGYTRSLTFATVVVDTANGEVNNRYSDELFEIIKSSHDYKGTIIDVGKDVIRTCETAALDHVVIRKDTIEEELNKTNEALINDRLNSLKQSYQYSVARVNDTLVKLRTGGDENKKIINMRENQLINMQKTYEQKTSVLECARRVVVSHEFIAGGILHVKGGQRK